MSEAFEQYRFLEKDLVHVRWQHSGLVSEEEEPILDEMEKVWYQLSEEEQQLLYNEGTKSLIRDQSDIFPGSPWTDEPKWRSESPSIIINWTSDDHSSVFSLSTVTVRKLRRVHGQDWARINTIWRKGGTTPL